MCDKGQRWKGFKDPVVVDEHENEDAQVTQWIRIDVVVTCGDVLISNLHFMYPKEPAL